MEYNRLKLRYYLDGTTKKELRLPFAYLTSPNISSTVNIGKYKDVNSKYYATFSKSINRSYNITISGIIADDAVMVHELQDMIAPADYKTLEQYITAIRNLESSVNFSFKPWGGTILITNIYIATIGIKREFKIDGVRLC